jgi:hypothetical protein
LLLKWLRQRKKGSEVFFDLDFNIFELTKTVRRRKQKILKKILTGLTKTPTMPTNTLATILLATNTLVY